MNTATKKSEAEAARALQEALVFELARKRLRYIIAAISLMSIGVGFGVAGLAMISLIALTLGLIFLSQYFDANGHLHEVRRRSTKSLTIDFSVLRRPAKETVAAPPAPSP